MTPKKVELDRTDRELLRALAADARASGASLAHAVGVAESTVSLRLRRLRQTGVIQGYRPRLDPAALGASLQALVSVRLANHDVRHVESFRREAPGWPGVLSLFHMGGADDYLLHVLARTADDLRTFVVQHVVAHPAVAHTETNLIFEHVDGTGWQELV